MATKEMELFYVNLMADKSTFFQANLAVYLFLVGLFDVTGIRHFFLYFVDWFPSFLLSELNIYKSCLFVSHA